MNFDDEIHRRVFYNCNRIDKYQALNAKFSRIMIECEYLYGEKYSHLIVVISMIISYFAYVLLKKV